MKEHLSGRASPTERTLAWLRARGYSPEKVEQRVNFGKTTRDFMGFADILAIRLGDKDGVLAVQATTVDHIKDRVAKIKAEPRARLWRQCGNSIWVVGWAKVAPETGRRKVYKAVIAQIGDNGA